MFVDPNSHATLSQRDKSGKRDQNNVAAIIKRKTRPSEYDLKRHRSKVWIKRHWNSRSRGR